MYKRTILALILCIVLLSGCGKKEYGDSKGDVNNIKTMPTVITTTAPTSVPDKYNYSFDGTAIIADSSDTTKEPAVTTKIMTEDDITKTNQIYKKHMTKYGASYDYFKGPYEWEGVNIKFVVPEGLYLTIQNDLPQLYTSDILNLSEDESLSEGTFTFEPYRLQNLGKTYDEYSKTDFECEAQYEFSYRFLDGDLEKNKAVYESFDDYKLYTFKGKTNITGDKVIVVYCMMSNGTKIRIRVKENSEYQEKYREDIKFVVDSFEYTDIDYIP